MANIIVTNGNRGLLSEAEIVFPAKPEGLPVPNNEEALRWWEDKAYKDLNKTVAVLGHVEALGYVWATTLADTLIDEMG